MPFQNIGAARDAIQGHFGTAWTAAFAPSAAPFVAWQDTNAPTPKADQNWVRIKWMHKVGFQATINTPGNRRFRDKGTLTVEVRSPTGDGLTNSDLMVNTVQAIFEGQNVGGTDGVIFRDVTPVEIGHDGPWFQVNVVVNFEYDRIR